MSKNLIFFALFLFVTSCSDSNNKIQILVDDSEKVTDFIESVAKDYESKNNGISFSVIKFNGKKEFEEMLSKNSPDILIYNSKEEALFKESKLIKTFNEKLDNIEIDQKIIDSVDINNSLPFTVAKKLVIYLNNSLIDVNMINTLSEIGIICENFKKTCFDVYPDFYFGNLVFANNNDEDETLNFFNKNISRGLLTGVISINDARTRFLASDVALIFDFDVNYKLYKEKLNDKLSIFKLPIDEKNNSYVVSNNETVVASILEKSRKDEKMLRSFIKTLVDIEKQKTLLNTYYKLPVLKDLLNENNLNNELMIISYRQFELSKLLLQKENLDINSIFTDK